MISREDYDILFKVLMRKGEGCVTEGKKLTTAAQFLKLPKGKNFLLLNAGLILTAVGIVFFKAPNHFVMGGTSGVSILLAYLFPNLNVGTSMFAINIALIIIGFLFLGKGIGASTVYSSIALSFYTWILDILFPILTPLTGDTMLELIWSVILPAVGSALVFNVGSSTGGTDIIALILQKKTSLQVGKALLVSDFVIVILAGYFLGISVFLYCALGTIMKSVLVDNFIEGFNQKKIVTIVSKCPEEIKEFIVKELKRSATIYQTQGAFTGDGQQAITTVLTRRQAMLLRNFLKHIDPHAFLTIVNTSETLGKGFREI